MIHDLDESLRALLVKKGKLNLGEIDLTFDAPDREWSGKLTKPTINLFLYDVHENMELRQHEWVVERHGRGPATKSKPAAWIDLSYLITVWANAVEDEHRLIWHILYVLLKYPLLPADVLQGALARIPHPLQTKAAHTDGAYRSLAELWGSLEAQLKPSVNYTVTVPLDRQVEVAAPLVTRKHLRFDQLTPGTTPDELIQIGGFASRKDTQAGIGRARVVIEELGLEVVTDEHGYFRLPTIPPGRFTLVVSTEEGKEVRTEATLPDETVHVPI